MNNWIIVLITLILSGFFSGMEIAFIRSNKLRIELARKKGIFSARIIAGFIKNPSKILGTLLLGNNIAMVIYGISMAEILEPVIIQLLSPDYASNLIVLIIQTILSALLILITAEFIPKVLFSRNPNAILGFFAVPAKVFYWAFYPIIHMLIGISEFLLINLFRLRFSDDSYRFSQVDLDHYIKEISPSTHKDGEVKQEIQMLQNAIDFRKVKLKECMIPRTEITALEENDTIDDLRNNFIESGHSKILIYKESVDHMIGFVHSSDLFKDPDSIKSVIHSIPIVTESMLANNVLSMFINKHKSIALVVDEFGGTSGIVTMEDIIEEIFGEIEDEYDVEDQIEKKLNDNEYILSARLEIDYLNEKYNLELPASDDYETLGGLIINIHESIPEINDIITKSVWKFIILDASESRIEQVKLIKDTKVMDS